MCSTQPLKRAHCSILTSDTLRRSWARKVLSQVKVRTLEENEQVITCARDKSGPIRLANQETNSTARARPQGYFYWVAFDYYLFLILLLQHFNLQVTRTTPNIMFMDLHVTQRSWALRCRQKFCETLGLFPLREGCVSSIYGEKRCMLMFGWAKMQLVACPVFILLFLPTEPWALCPDKDKDRGAN